MDTPNIPSKRCTKCGQEFPATTEYFEPHKESKDGLRAYCRVCRRAQNKANYQRQPDKFRQKSRKNYSDNAEQRRQEKRDYRAQFPDREITAKKQYYEQHGDRVRKAVSDYRKNNPQKVKESKQKHYRENPDQYRAQGERYRARKRNLPADYTKKDWQFALEHFNNRCAVCGRPTGLWHKLVPDHWIPLNDSRADNPGTVPTNIVPLCHSFALGVGGCNNSKKDKDAIVWLIDKFGKRKAKSIKTRIETFFSKVRGTKAI